MSTKPAPSAGTGRGSARSGRGASVAASKRSGVPVDDLPGDARSEPSTAITDGESASVGVSQISRAPPRPQVPTLSDYLWNDGDGPMTKAETERMRARSESAKARRAAQGRRRAGKKATTAALGLLTLAGENADATVLSTSGGAANGEAQSGAEGGGGGAGAGAGGGAHGDEASGAAAAGDASGGGSGADADTDTAMAGQQAGSASAPVVRWDESLGKLQVVAGTTVRTEVEARNRAQLYESVDETAGQTTTTSYTKWSSPDVWSPLDTKRFYTALRMCGTDFSKMAQLFEATEVKRNRRQLRSKYHKERRAKPHLVQVFELKRIPFDKAAFLEVRSAAARQAAAGTSTADADATVRALPQPQRVARTPVRAIEDGDADDDVEAGTGASNSVERPPAATKRARSPAANRSRRSARPSRSSSDGAAARNGSAPDTGANSSNGATDADNSPEVSRSGRPIRRRKISVASDVSENF